MGSLPVAPAAPAASPAAPLSLSSAISPLRSQLRAHPFETVLGLWGSVLAATGAFLWRRQIPLQLKIIQARILAQASLVTGAGLFALSSLGGAADEAADAPAALPPATQQFLLRAFEEVPADERNRPAMGRGARPARPPPPPQAQAQPLQ